MGRCGHFAAAASSAVPTPHMVAPVNDVMRTWGLLCVGIDQVMRHERCSDDESDSYPRIGYLHFIDPSRACLALESGVNLALSW